MEYKKKFVKKDGRILTGGGPRDQNRRINYLDVPVTIVKEVVNELQPNNLFTGEEVDKQVIEAVEKVNLKVNMLELEKENLNNRISDLTSIIKDKDSLISNLTEMNNKFSDTISKFSSGEKTSINYVDEDIDRPTMAPVFVDPIDAGSEEELIPHIVVKDTSNEEKENVDDKVNKLKNLLGSLKK